MAGSISRLLAVAVLAAAILAAAGLGAEAWRFGLSSEAAASRLERDVRARFDRRANEVRTLAEKVAAEAKTVAAAVQHPDDLPALFGRLTALAPAPSGGISPSTVTVYVAQPGGQYQILAWSDGPAENIAADRLSGDDALFVAPGTLGLRLVQVKALMADGRRVVAAAETVLAPPIGVGPASGTYRLDTTFGPVTLRFPGTSDIARRTGGFALVTQGGVVDVDVLPDDLHEARLVFRRRVLAAAAAPLALAALLLTGPIVRRRRDAQSLTAFAGWSAAVACIVALTAAASMWLCSWVAAPANVALAIQGLAALGMAVALPVSIWWRRAQHRLARRAAWRFITEQLLAGGIVALGVWTITVLLRQRITPVALEEWQYPLFPLEPGPLIFLTSLLLAEVATYWTFTAVLAFMATRWRLRWRNRWTWAGGALWFAPAAALLFALGSRRPSPQLSWILPLAAAGTFAIAAAEFRRRYRQTTQGMRLLLLYTTLLAPVLVLYPVGWFFADSTAREIVAQDYAPRTAHLPDDTLDVLKRVRNEIDRIPLSRLASLVSASEADTEPLPHFPAFDVWNQTSLAATRSTGAIELYGPEGSLVSRFALNVPEFQSSADTNSRVTNAGCAWQPTYGEAVPFGAEERDMLHARREICDEAGRPLGALVVHVINDYQALPFVSTPAPYREVLRSPEYAARGSVLAGLQVVVYGWSFTPLFTSGHVAWPITTDLFARLYRSREPFWTRLKAEGHDYEVYFSNDSRFIYALGYPSSTWFQHVTRLAEGAALVALVFVMWLVGAGLYAPFARRQSAPLPALFDEIRTSFYRKLFLLFVVAAVGPVLIFATAFGIYMNARLRSDVESEASTVVTVARRVLEQSAASGALGPFDDEMMVLVGQVVHQDVNLFDGPELLATSQRDLYASGVLPSRTPAQAYRAIALNRLPTFVGEEWLGPFGYVVAAAPMPASGRNFVLSVPLASRQREIEREVDELYRGVLVGGVLVVLFAAALGASAAGRVSDPVARLSRATRQIAAGRLDVRLVAETADELSRLIEDFNTMAATLSEQRAELARAHQLRAWAEMARQVAHEIKNPLTPIQLAAEHLDHVHADLGRPLGAVFDQCVTTVLRQVRLLRQIASEFANFAGQPAARLGAVPVHEAVEDVIRPYRAGLDPRTRLETDIPATLPEVSADRTLIARAFTNFVENALQAMPEGGTLRVAATADEDTVTVTFTDTGVGMDADAAARAFEPYFSTKTAGSGLGLANARRNIEICGGAVALVSAPGRGTSVRVSLPRYDRRDVPEAGSTPTQ